MMNDFENNLWNDGDRPVDPIPTENKTPLSQPENTLAADYTTVGQPSEEPAVPAEEPVAAPEGTENEPSIPPEEPAQPEASAQSDLYAQQPYRTDYGQFRYGGRYAANMPPVYRQEEWKPVGYTPVAPQNDYRPASRGLRVFCLILAAVILLTGGCITGYFMGRSSMGSFSGLYRDDIDVDLAAKPKDTDESTAAEVYDAVSQSIVGIRVYNSAGAMADASGVIYTEDGYIVTNDHIYAEVGAPNFKVYMQDGTEYDAVYVAGDVVSDLAVLKIENGSGLVPAEFGNSDELVCGEHVVAIGRPSDATTRSSITDGIVSLTKRRVTTTSNYSARLIQTNSAINPGSSGGALVNMYNQVVGITSSKLAGVDYDAVGFAIPTTTVKRVVEQLISSGRVTDRAKLGITYTEINSVTAEMGDYSSVGLLIQSVSEDSDLYGQADQNDIITHVNGVRITNDDIVLDIIEDSRAGDTLTVTILHANGGVGDYTVKLGANIGESSYSEVIQSDSSDSPSAGGGGTFDFPFGE